MTTPVLFRKFPEGDTQQGGVIALFPTIPADQSPAHCLSYQHVGQHGAASIDLVLSLSPATENEYLPLLRELEGQGYSDLRVYKRYQFSFTRERLTQMAA